MTETVKITQDCDSRASARPESEVLSRVRAGSILQLLRDEDRDYLKVAFRGRPVYVPRSCSERVVSSEIRELVADSDEEPIVREIDLSERRRNQLEWRRFAGLVGGEWMPPKMVVRQFGLEHKDQGVVVGHEGWHILLEQYSGGGEGGTYKETTVRAPYTSADRFNFRLVPDLGVSFLRGQDIRVPFPELDEAFLVKTNDESKVRTFLENKTIRDLILRQPQPFTFTCRGRWKVLRPWLPRGSAELFVGLVGWVADVERLKSLVDLFSESLDQLQRMGSASPPQ